MNIYYKYFYIDTLGYLEQWQYIDIKKLRKVRF